MCLGNVSYFDEDVSLKSEDMFLTELEESIGSRLSRRVCVDGKRNLFARSGSSIIGILGLRNEVLLPQVFPMERKITTWEGIRSGRFFELHTE